MNNTLWQKLLMGPSVVVVMAAAVSACSSPPDPTLPEGDRVRINQVELPQMQPKAADSGNKAVSPGGKSGPVKGAPDAEKDKDKTAPASGANKTEAAATAADAAKKPVPQTDAAPGKQAAPAPAAAAKDKAGAGSTSGPAKAEPAAAPLKPPPAVSKTQTALRPVPSSAERSPRLINQITNQVMSSSPGGGSHEVKEMVLRPGANGWEMTISGGRGQATGKGAAASRPPRVINQITDEVMSSGGSASSPEVGEMVIRPGADGWEMVIKGRNN